MHFGFRFSARLLITLMFASLLVAQAPNPPYLAGMPTPDQVKSQIQGSDPTDSLARQVAVFTYLSAIVDRVRVQRSYSAPATPDEQRVKYSYDLTAYQITQAFSKAHTPAETKAFEQLHGRYEMDSKFYDDWYNRLLTPEARSFYETGQTGDAAHAKAQFDAKRQQAQPAQASGAAQSKSGHSSIGIFGDIADAAMNHGILDNDASTKAERRCLELGGSNAECTSTSLTTSVVDLMESFSPGISKNVKFAGLQMGGSYRAESGIVLGFAGAATIAHCGDLIADGYNYTVTRRGVDFLIDVETQPRPLHLELSPSGIISGPGMMEIRGRIITGYEVHNVQQRYVADGSIVPGSAHQESYPIYAARTARCSLPQFQPVAAAAPASNGPDLCLPHSSATSPRGKLRHCVLCPLVRAWPVFMRHRAACGWSFCWEGSLWIAARHTR